MFESPEAKIKQLLLRPCPVVVDMGAGMGDFSIPCAKHVGKNGTVYAVEVQRQLLNVINENTRHAGVSNVRVIWGDIERDHGTKLANNIADVVIIANTLFQVENKDATISECIRLLKNGGRLLVVDWKETSIGAGPRPNQLVTTVALDSLMSKFNLKRSETINAGSHHYGIIYR
ncbi:MAG: class I SAM-dependent methyltransferase [Minisyncoccia bacterium]